ncbi:MAG: hypothetical protein EZS28_039980 [Streblomastix strix]|uniref:Uncharacterized protein n=1 Tax=Streblomastix strix TaxID=222440 RepID=A0A5J4U2K4_9EUKA|nr:MAG: hypothetical protein EZS28_039980 [Streblomastix strix]
MDAENLKHTQKVGRPKKHFTEYEAQEMAKKQRGEAKKRQPLNDDMIRLAAILCVFGLSNFNRSSIDNNILRYLAVNVPQSVTLKSTTLCGSLGYNLYHGCTGLQVMYQCKRFTPANIVGEDQNEVIPQINILVVESEWEGKKISHAFAIANKQALTGLKFCPHCNSKAFDPKDQNYSRDYEKHTIK